MVGYIGYWIILFTASTVSIFPPYKFCLDTLLIPVKFMMLKISIIPEGGGGKLCSQYTGGGYNIYQSRGRGEDNKYMKRQ